MTNTHTGFILYTLYLWQFLDVLIHSNDAPGVGDGQGSLANCSPWGCKESDMTEQLK